MTDDTPTLLVVRASGLGDLLMALPALRGLRRHFPRHRLVMTCPSTLAPLAHRLHLADSLFTEVTEDIPDPSEHEKVDQLIMERLLADAMEVDIVASLRVPEPAELAGLLRKGPRILIAYRHSDVEETATFPAFDFADYILRRWERLLDAFDVATRRTDVHVDCDGPDAPGAAGHTLIHVGAGSPARRWPTERWSAVAAALEAQGHRVIVTGSRGEAELAAVVSRAAGLPPDGDRSGTSDALALAELVAGAGLVLSTDTGIAHLATALRRRSVTLFGPTPPEWWGPPPGCPLHRTLWRGCHGQAYADHPDPGLLAITVDDVLAAVTAPGWPAPHESSPYSCAYLRRGSSGPRVSSSSEP